VNRLKYPGLNEEFLSKWIGGPVTEAALSEKVWWWREARRAIEETPYTQKEEWHTSFVWPLRTNAIYRTDTNALLSEWLATEALMRVKGKGYLPAPLHGGNVTIDLSQLEAVTKAPINILMSREEIMEAVKRLRDERGIRPSSDRAKRNLATFNALEDFDRATLLHSEGDDYRNAYRLLDSVA